MLSGIARMLEEQLRRNDILGRLGGDEFAIVLTETSREHARTVVGSLERRSPAKRNTASMCTRRRASGL